jgi:anti-sigma factor RsiW
MDCTENRKRLHAYIDQELDAATSWAIDEHLSACRACNALFVQQARLQSAIRAHAEYYKAPAGAAERIRAELGVAAAWPPPHRPRRERRRLTRLFELGFALGGAAIVSWILAVRLVVPGPADVLADQVIAGHARAVLTSHLVDVETSDRHTVKPWLSSKLDFSPAVKDLDAQGFRLVGGRLDYVANRPVAALVYLRRKHVIDLFVWPDETAGARLRSHRLSKHGYNLLNWTEGGMRYWIVSDLERTELEAFAESYAAAQ